MKLDRFNVRLSPLSITIFYACVGGIWLLLASAKMIRRLFLDPSAYERIEIYNSIFILVTAWLLYVLIRKSESGIKQHKESLSRLNRSLKAYSECHQALIRANDEKNLMQNICRTIVEVGGYRVAWVGVAENDDIKSIRPVVQWGDEMGYLKNLNVSWSNTDQGRGPTGTAIKTGTPVVVQYIEFDPKWEIWRENALRHGFYSSISLPLFSNGLPFAALVIFSGETCSFDIEEVKLLVELSNDLSYGITTLRAAIERKSVEKERKLLASVIKQAKEGIFLFDSEGIIQYVNPAIETITGRTPFAMIGQNIHVLESQEPNRLFYETILKAISRGEEHDGLFPYQRKDGVMFELDVTTWSVSDSSGNIISYVALVRDVTHEIQLERQLRQSQRMEAIGTLAGGIAHDFNNTLASIITCSELAIEEASTDGPLQELLDVILRSGLRGKNLVKQILTFSRQGEQERQEVSVELVVGECLKLLRASLPSSIEIMLSLDDNLGSIVADPTQIHQIIMNLCTNAVHAMQKQGRGILNISLENLIIDECDTVRFRDLPNGHYLQLKVRDSGHGMDEATMERIFDPFFTTKGQADGTGLGLSVIHGIVKNQGGAISVESKPGQGALFTVLLPCMGSSIQHKVDDKLSSVPVGCENILLVDDEEDVVFAAQRMLDQLGYHVTALSDPCQALQMFREHPDRFDLVITDQTMPNMNGTELARELTHIRQSIPVILCTGYDPTFSSTANNNEQPADFICELALKPLERREIAEIIRRVLDESRQQEHANG
jgi:PAS domain S-box-containing protein